MSAIVRVFTALAFAFALMVALPAPSAQAACIDARWCDTESEAQARALANCTDFPHWITPGPVAVKATHPNQTVGGVLYVGGYTAFGGPGKNVGCNTYSPHSQPVYWRAEQAPNLCGEKPPLGPQGVSGAAQACFEGCMYSGGGSTNVCLGGNSYCFASVWNATGAQCAEGAPSFAPNHKPDQEVCTAANGYTHCVQQSGRQCVTSGSGVRSCWDPGQEAQRMTTDGSEGASRVKDPATPAPAPAMENPTATSNQSTTINGQTYNTTTYTGTGNNGGQGDTGDGGNDSGGNGEGDGQGEDEEDEGPGSAGGVGGDLYEGDDRTMAGIMAAHRARIMAAPILQAGTDFFEIDAGGAGCPVWTIPESDWNPPLVFDFFCMPELAGMLEIAGLVFLAFAAMYAFHVAIGD